MSNPTCWMVRYSRNGQEVASDFFMSKEPADREAQGWAQREHGGTATAQALVCVGSEYAWGDFTRLDKEDAARAEHVGFGLNLNDQTTQELLRTEFIYKVE